jgi:AraC-like DNA-binding protein
MGWAAAAIALVGTIYSSNKQDKAARRQEEALRRSQSESRAEAEKGKQEIKKYYGDAMGTIDIMTPEIIEQFKQGQLTTQSYLANFTDASNKILDFGADDFKRELLGLPERSGSDSRIYSIGEQETIEPTYGLRGAESAIEQARFNAAQDITQGRDSARRALTDIARRGEQDLTSNFEQARQQLLRSSADSGRDIERAAGTAQDRLTQSQAETDKILRSGQASQLNLLREGQQGMRQALTQGYDDAMASERGGYNQAREDLNEALRFSGSISTPRVKASVGHLNPYSRAGAKSTALELALSGAAGPEAQAEAYANFQESAGQKFLRERQEQSLLRNAAATGGLQGGNVLTALQEQAQGIASQDLQRQIANLQSISGRGLQAAGQISSLETQANQANAQLKGQANIARGQLQANIASKLADLAQRTGLSESQLSRGLGEKLAAMQGQFMGAESQLRLGTQDQRIAGIRETAGNLANIDMQTAGQIAGLDAATAERLYQSLQQQGLSTNQINQVLGGNLAGLETGAASQLAGNQMQSGGIIGNMRMGVGQQLASNIGQTRQQQSQNIGNLGNNLANLNDQTTQNIANILQNQMTNKSQLQAGLGTNLGNISVGQGTNTLNFANQMSQAAGMRDIAQANKVTGITNALGNLASNVDWGSMGSSDNQQQQPTGQSAISDETFIRGTNQWGGNP